MFLNSYDQKEIVTSKKKTSIKKQKETETNKNFSLFFLFL
jgi:hypothetical protein